MSALGRAVQHYHRAGLRGVLTALAAKVVRRPLRLAVRVPGLEHPILMRMRTSDPWVYQQIFVDGEYDVPLPEDPKVIVDAGANVGYSAVYFANRFPGALVLAIEPEPKNFTLLRRNAEPYANIRALHGALWTDEGGLDVLDAGSGEWGFRTRPAASGASTSTVPSYTMRGLMDAESIDHVDVLKIDIEGAEREVFSQAGAWIHRVSCIVIELHEQESPGAVDAFESSTAGFEFRGRSGENVIVSRLPLSGRPT